MHSIHEMKFRRRFSINPYKMLRMKLGGMDCYKNWVDSRRGDPYPVVSGNEHEGAFLTESLPSARYRAENHTEELLFKARLLGQHFPYATYEIALDEPGASPLSGLGVQILACGEAGSAYTKENEPCLRIWASVEKGTVQIRKEITAGGAAVSFETVDSGKRYAPGMSLTVTSRGRFFDVYLDDGATPGFVCSFEVKELSEILLYDTFVRSTASLLVRAAPGDGVQGAAEFFLEGGISHADMKCMRYENGMPVMERGRLFMTLSARLQEGAYQAVISWNPSSADIRLEGALFFDLGDGMWCSDIASSVVYNRKTGEWYVWACAFSHGHALCHAVSTADLRYGIHVLDAEVMQAERLEASDGDDSLAVTSGGGMRQEAVLSDDRLFMAKRGDEDPDLVYDEERGKWLLAVCRVVEENGRRDYRYFLFESDDPFEGFVYVDQTREGCNTGGSIIRVGGEKYLLCGSDFDKRARYQLHPLKDLSECSCLEFDFDDGGFRGWGTLIPVPCGRRTRYVMMTFDRHNGSDYNWSYGNLHVFEADRMNEGWEWADTRGPLA